MGGRLCSYGSIDIKNSTRLTESLQRGDFVA